MARLSAYVKQRIVSLKEQGLSISLIRSLLEKEDHVKCSRQAIGAFLKRWGETGSINPQHGGGCLRKLTQTHLDFMDAKLTEVMN